MVMKYGKLLLLIVILCSCMSSCLAYGQTTESTAMGSDRFDLQAGTPVKLRLNTSLSSATARKGETVDFEVLDDVSVQDMVVIARGSIALATITEAEPKGHMGRGGKLDVSMDSVRLKDGEKVPLSGTKGGKGGGHTGAMTGAMVATSIVAWPAAPFFLFMHGKDINIPKGTEVTAYVASDVALHKSKFLNLALAAPDSANSGASVARTTVSISSVPPGADIQVDGKFIGNTPSSVTVSVGDHEIQVGRKGYRTWRRQLSATGGVISVGADLEPEK